MVTLLFAVSVSAQSTSFSYQGHLNSSGAAVSGQYDLQFRLYDALNGGTQIGSTVTKMNVTVTGGLFSVMLDFGAGAFPGADRWLEVSAKLSSDSSYTNLSPLQQIVSTPYAIQSLNAATTTSFSGSLSGDVTGIQGATVVSTIGGQTAATVAGGAGAANAATSNNSANTIVKRDNLGNFTAGIITGSLNGNASTATTASGVSPTAGDSVITAINGSSLTVDQARVSGVVRLAPSSQQTTSSTNALINLKLNGSGALGIHQQNPFLSLSASGTYNTYGGFNYTFTGTTTLDREFFRMENSGSFVAFGEPGVGEVPVEDAGTRFMWFAGRAAIRAGGVSGSHWDASNVGPYSAAFGYDVRASGDYGFAVGQNSVAAANNSTAMGHFVTATGPDSVALGYYAHTNTRVGSFVFSDRSVLDDGNSSTDESFKAAVNHSFNVRATGGYYLYTNTAVSTGLRLSHLTPSNTSYGSFVWTDRSSDSGITPTTQNQTIFRSSGGYTIYTDAGASAGVTIGSGGGAWSSLSDRNMKANFQSVNPREVLRGVLSLPISTWNYKSQNAPIRHIGPMAQDFFAAFKVGDDDKHITTIDPDGVALAAIQGLHEELKDRDAKIEQLQQQLQKQQTMLESLRQLLCQHNSQSGVCK